MRQSCWFALVGVVCAGLILLVAGCGDQCPSHPVSGKITFAGKPLAGGGSIRLAPLAQQGGREAGGNIALDGTYQLSTCGINDGAIAGEYRVEVIQNPVLQPAVRAPVQPTTGGEPATAPPISPEVRVPSADLIPQVYTGPNSPLRVVVEAKENKDVDLDLKRQP